MNLVSEFPNLKVTVNGKKLVYLDSAATTLKPKVVIDRITQYYSFENSNVHRGAHYLSQTATDHFEQSRQTIAKFINASSVDEIIFTKGTTEGFNFLAETLGQTVLQPDDEVIVTVLEHHANIVPWHGLKERMGINLKFSKLTENGQIDIEHVKSLVSAKTKVLSFSACSNTLGSIPNVKELIKLATERNIISIVDAAQYVTQENIDVQSLNCDFLVFSGHKIFGPTGIGILFGKKKWLNKLPPYQRGGSMIQEVSESGSTYHRTPFRFEAGTPHIEGVLGLATAIEFFQSLDIEAVKKNEDHLSKMALFELSKLSGIILYPQDINPIARRAPIISFNLEGAHCSDVASLLDQQGVAVRAGHHCTQPLMKFLNIKGTVRASFSIYNTEEDVLCLIQAVKKAKDMLL